MMEESAYKSIRNGTCGAETFSVFFFLCQGGSCCVAQTAVRKGLDRPLRMSTLPAGWAAGHHPLWMGAGEMADEDGQRPVHRPPPPSKSLHDELPPSVGSCSVPPFITRFVILRFSFLIVCIASWNEREHIQSTKHPLHVSTQIPTQCLEPGGRLVRFESGLKGNELATVLLLPHFQQ